MVAGGAAIIPKSIFDPVRPLTAAIASEMGEVSVGSLHYSALFTAGLILLTISFILTLISKTVIGVKQNEEKQSVDSLVSLIFRTISYITFSIILIISIVIIDGARFLNLLFL